MKTEELQQSSFPKHRIAPKSFEELSPVGKAALRSFLYVVQAPPDKIGHTLAIGTATRCVKAYRDLLISPNQLMEEIEEQMRQLGEEIGEDIMKWHVGSRRLSQFPSWKMLIALSSGESDKEIRESIGAEIAYCMHTQRRFSKTLAQLTLKVVKERELSTAWRNCAARIKTRSDKLFDQGGVSEQDITTEDPFLESIKRHFRAKVFFGRDKDHQCVSDARSETDRQLMAHAGKLRAGVESGDETSALTVIAGLSGIPLKMAMNLPLQQSSMDEDWLMVLDAQSGCLKTSIELFSEGRAAGNRSSALALAGDIIVKPLPSFLAEYLRGLAKLHASPDTLGDLLEGANPFEKAPRRHGLDATPARLKNALPQFAVRQGVDRYVAALIFNEPRIVPTGKFFYATASREEIWSASTTLYDVLGWGDPVNFQDGLAVGSRVTPKDSTIREWHKWMADQLSQRRPGKRYQMESLIEFHNKYALYCASMTTFLLALRQRKQLCISGRELVSDSRTIGIFDKRVGEFPSKRPVPVSDCLRKVFDYWSGHCRVLDARLAKLGLDELCSIRQHLREIIECNEASAFFIVNEKQKTVPVGSYDLASWWAETYGLETNFGRHFWQTALRHAGIASSEIDAFVRHSVSGCDPSSLTSSFVMADWIARIVKAIDSTIESIGITPVSGLFSGRNEK